MFLCNVEHTFASKAGVLVEMQRIVWFVFKRHLLYEAVSFSLPSVISTMLIIRPRAASTLIQPKTLMEHNEPHSFPAAYQTLSRDSITTEYLKYLKSIIVDKKQKNRKEKKRKMWLM